MAVEHEKTKTKEWLLLPFLHSRNPSLPFESPNLLTGSHRHRNYTDFVLITLAFCFKLDLNLKYSEMFKDAKDVQPYASETYCVGV